MALQGKEVGGVVVFTGVGRHTTKHWEIPLKTKQGWTQGFLFIKHLVFHFLNLLGQQHKAGKQGLD